MYNNSLKLYNSDPAFNYSRIVKFTDKSFKKLHVESQNVFIAQINLFNPILTQKRKKESKMSKIINQKQSKYFIPLIIIFLGIGIEFERREKNDQRQC